MLTFACQVYHQGKPGEPMRFKASALCIDKRTGRTLYEKESDNPMGIFRVAGDAEKHTVDVTTQQKTVTLKFTDKPIPSPTSASAEAAKSSSTSSPSRALWNALQKVLGLSGDSGADED